VGFRSRESFSFAQQQRKMRMQIIKQLKSL